MSVTLSDLPRDPSTGTLPGRWRVRFAAHLDDSFRRLQFRGGVSQTPANDRQVRQLVAAMGERIAKVEPWDKETAAQVLAAYEGRELPSAFAYLREPAKPARKRRRKGRAKVTAE